MKIDSMELKRPKWPLDGCFDSYSPEYLGSNNIGCRANGATIEDIDIHV